MSRFNGSALARIAAVVAVGFGLLVPPPAQAGQSGARFLAKEDILLYGLGLKVEPAQQTVPKDIATIVGTFLQAPQFPLNLPAFAADAEVVATLRGPSLPQSIELHVKPNSPFHIPPLGVAGTHTLDNIRLVSNGVVLLRGVPDSTRIDVIDKLLVTQVTSRALSAQEIREKGIVFDKSNFQAYNFAAAFAIADHPININFTVVLPTVQGAADISVSNAALPTVSTVPAIPSLKTLIPDTLKLQTQIPNLTVVGFALTMPQLNGQDFGVPPIPGVIVIPGDIGFLNQYFSVMLMVSNAAPGASNLVVTGLRATIVLPPGRDGVAGTPDDPLAMARVANGESLRVQPVVQLGADAVRGTSDDVDQLAPQETGNAEYLVEGRREGSHVVEMQITGTLEGLPIGPVTVTGRAAGSVLVRNPTFTLTFTHPEIVNAGEPYSLDVTVTNTSESPANFVSVSLHGQHISGATLIGEATKDIESIPAGDSATISFDLISKLTGRVTAATLDSDQNVAGRFELKTSVGELGVPLSPDSLMLPPEANGLPKPLRTAAIGLLGKAHAVATAPAAALPPDIRRFTRQIVIDSAVQVAEAGLRVTLHESIPDSALQLAMDFAGSDYGRLAVLHPKAEDLAFAQNDRIGFDELRRKSVRGDTFAQAVATILADSVSALGVSAFHRQMAEKVAYRPSHISVMAGAAGPLPFEIALLDSAGRQLGGKDAAGKVRKQIPFGEAMTFSTGGATTAALALITTPDPGDYVIRLDPIAGGTQTPITLSVVVPTADGVTLRQIVFENVGVGSVPTVAFTPGDPFRFTVQIGGAAAPPSSALAPSTDTAIIEPPPAIIGVVQQALADALKCDVDEKSGIPVGRIVAVLFSKEVTIESAQDKARPEDITNYTSAGNRVVGVALQPGRRIVYLALRDPVGPYAPAELTIAGVADTHGHAMPSQSVPIETTIDAGGVVSGRVLQADGTPVPNANVRLFYLLTCGDPQWVGISSKHADDTGRYSWNFVGNTLPDRIVAVDEGTGEFRDVRFTIQRNAQQLTVDIVLLGRGTLQGRTLAEDGTPLRDTAVRVTSLTDQSQYGATTDADGRFSITRIPVGNILIEAVNVAARAKTFVSQAIPSAGATTFAEFVLLTVESTQVTLKTGTVTGTTLAADGIAPVRNVPVIAWYQTNSQPGIACPPDMGECAVAVVNSDAVTGAYRMDGVTAGTIRLQTFDQTSLQQGEARIILPADGTIVANILLAGGVGTVTGRVLDATGAGVPNARVGGGLSLTTTDAAGQFTLVDVPVGHRDIVAVSDALGVRGSVGIDLLQAGETIGATIVLPATGSVAGTVFEADRVTPVAGVTVNLFTRDGASINVVGTAVTGAGGQYRIDKVDVGDYYASAFRPDFSDGNIRPVPLKYFNQVARGDIVFRGGGGKITGVALDDDGQTPLRAAVSVSGDQLVIAGGRVGVEFKYVQNYKVTQTDFTTGRYQFGGIWVGKATIRAAGQFSPDPISLDATIPAANATVTLDIRLKATSRLTGTVFQPDGATPVAANVIVNFKSDQVRVVCSEAPGGEMQCASIPQGIQQEIVVTDEHGEFLVPVVNAGVYTVTVEDPVTGRIGIAHGSVKPAEDGHVTVRLLGRGNVTVVVKGSDGTTPIPAAKVVLEQTDYPKKAMTVITDGTGTTVFSGGDELTEGPFAVIATDQRNGFSGRASGKVTHDGEQVTVTVYLYDAWGTVTGHVFRPDGLTTVPFSDVVVSNAAGPLALSITDAAGTFFADYIPIGPVFIETFEPATARIGSAATRIDFAQQTVPIDVVENALGLVKGVLLQSGSLTPLKGWEVSLGQVLPSGRVLPTLRTTSSIDGSFSFPGASEGLLSLQARREGVIGSASAQTRLTREGQIIDVPLIATLATQLTGSVIGKVFAADGTAGANALVQVCDAVDCGPASGVTVTAGPDGTFGFDDLPLGRFIVRARSQVTTDSGSAIGEIRFDGETAGVTVALRGLSTITGAVLNGDGSVAAGAKLELTGLPSSDCEGPCVQFALPDGTFRFVGVSASSFTIVATGAVSESRGIAGDRLVAGQTRDVVIRLEPFGQLSGRVLLPGGVPAANIVAELVFGPRHLFTQSGADGRYVFAVTPLGGYALTLQDPIGTGIVSRTGTVTGPTTVPDVVLDIAPPTIVNVSPAPSASGVARTASVQITFSEAIDPGSASQANVTVSDGVSTIVGTLQTGNGDTTVTFAPLALLKDETRFTIRVTDIRDRVGKTLVSAYVTSFTTIDITPPRAVAIDPAPSTSGVAIDAAIRIKYSEAIDPTKFAGPAITVSGSAGGVDGRIDYLFSNTTVVFTPNRAFADGATYSVARAAARDLAGLVEVAPAAYSFSTTDRTPPVIAGLVAPSTVIENGQATVVANLGPGSDVAVVDFSINDVFSLAARTAPFALTFQAIPGYGKPGDTIRITALATDTSGNRSTVPAATAIAVTADAPPVVVLTVTTPTNQLSARNNDFVVVKVRATDDLGVMQLGYKAQTGNAIDAGTRPASAALDRTESFSFHVPADAAPGSMLRVQASAADTKGQITQASPVDILVLDAIAPAVTITGATTGTKVNPGQQTTVAVLVEDSGGIASITVNVSGVAQLTQTRVVDPAQTSAITSFTFTIPATAKSTDSVSVVATATDRAGNVGTSGNIVFPVSDRTAPTITLHTESGLTDVAPGQRVVMLADADDDVSIATIDLTGSGAVTVSQSQGFPLLANAHADFTFDIPAGTPDGATIALQARATDHAGNVSAAAALTLTVRATQAVTLPASVVLKAGEQAVVAVDITAGAAGALRVDFSSGDTAVATVSPSVLFAVGDTSKTFVVTGEAGGTVQITASVGGVPSASMTAVVRGGIVTGIVTDDRLQPVGGAEITVSGGSSVAAVSAADGSYSVEGIVGPEVAVRVTDPATHLYGFTTGLMNRSLGHADISVVMTTAASIAGTVFESDALTPAGAGIKVDIYESTDMRAPRATVFTGEAGAYAFPFVQLGEYVLDATGHNGERARATVRLEVSAEQATVPLSFLGHGTVVGTVIGGLGQPVNAAAVSFHASSIVGAAPEVQVTTDNTGTFRFEGVLVGQFWLSARDATTGQAGSIAGVITRAGDAVTADVHLAAYATLAGTVYRADGTTTVAGATVTTSSYRTTTTDEAGRYQFDIVPLGPIGLRVDDGSARGKGVASATLTSAGTTRTLDVVLFPQGSVVVTVLDANSLAVANANVYLNVSNGVIADSIYTRAGVSGVAVIDHVLAGTFDLTADNGVLKGLAVNRHLAANQIQQVTIHLQPTGAIAGLAVEADGLTPAPGGRVDIRYADFFVATAPIGEDGTYRFNQMVLDPYGYDLYVYDAAGRFRALAKRVPVTRNGEVVEKNFTFVGLGRVRGQVTYAATGGTAAGFTVTVQTRNPSFTAAHDKLTNAAGFYEIDDVPVGPFTASTGNLHQQLWGEMTGTLAHAGDTATIDILLQNNAIALPLTRHDANDFAFDVQPDGTLELGSNAFSGALVLDLVVGGVPHRFTGGEVPTAEQSGREIVTRQNGLAGLNVTRKLFVPLTGYFARGLELFSNPTADPITVDVHLESGLAAGMTIRSTSSGDGFVSVADAANPDRWVVFDDPIDADPAIAFGRPAAAFVFDGAGAPARAAAAAVAGTPSRLQLGWTQITVPADGNVALLHFAAQQTTRLAMAASTDRLVRLAPEALEGMTPDEIASVVNFAVPADGHSAVAALPALTGTVSGHVFEADGSTPAPFTQLAFISDVPVFGRTHRATADAAGAFTFLSAADDGSSRPIPIDAFALAAEHPATHVASPPLHGAFESDQSIAQLDVVFNNTAMVSGTVLRHTGVAVTAGTVRFSLVLNGSAIVSAPIGGDARYRATGLLPGTYVLAASITHPQGSALVGVGSVTVIAGTVVDTADLTIQATGSITGMLSTASGTPVPGVVVTLGNGAGTVSREVRTDTGGGFTFSDVPAGAVTLSAADPTTGIRMSAPATVVTDLPTPVALKFPAVGRLEVQVNFQRGVGAAAAPLQLQEAVRGLDFRGIGTTDFGGHKTMNGLSAGAFVVRAAHPNNARIVVTAPGTLTQDGSAVPVTITLPPAGTVRGVVTDSHGAVAGIAVTIRSTNAAFGGFQTATTDAAGAYAIAGVPDGPFTATVQEFGRQLFGEAAGRIDTDGQDVTVNISLINNAVALPAYRYDGNGLKYLIEANGRVSDATNNTFGYSWMPETGASRLEIVSNGVATPFAGANVGTTEQDGREIVVRQADIAGLSVTRKVFVPRAGYFARYLELLTNPGTAPITVDLRVTSTVFGLSYYPRSIAATSSGDTTLDVSDSANADRWITFDDTNHADPFRNGGPMPTAFVFDGPAAARRVSAAAATGSDEQALAYQWQSVTVPAGQTVGVMHYVVEQVTAAGAAAAATRLSLAPPEALDGLSPEEIGAIQNFALPADGTSTVDPLPSLTGSVSGRVLGNDSLTIVPNARMTFTSLHPLFGRTWELQAGDDGAFSVKGRVDDSYQTPVPVAPFTLHATHPRTYVEIDQPGDFTGTFAGNLALALGQPTASSTYSGYYPPQNAIDADVNSFWYTEAIEDAHWFEVSFPADVTVSGLAMSTAGLLSARIDLIDAAGQVVATAANVDASAGTAAVTIDGQGVRRVRVTDESNSYWLSISDLRIFGSAAASAGVAEQDVVFSNAGTVVVTIHKYGGALVTNGNISVQSGAPQYVYVNGSVIGGEGRITGLPAGSYSVTADITISQSYSLSGSATVEVIAGETSTVDVRLQPTGTIRGTITHANGAPSVGSYVRLEHSYPFRVVQAATDSTGYYVFDDVPLSYYQLIAYEPNTGYRSYAFPNLTAGGQVLTQNFTHIGLGSVRLHVQYANGAPAAGASVLVSSAWGGDVTVGTDANGDGIALNLVEGPFSVRAEHPRNAKLSTEVSGVIAGDSDSPEITLVLPAAGSVTGTVTRPDGTPVPNPDVSVNVAGALWGPSSVFPSGQFEFDALPAGQPLKVRAYWGAPYPYRVFYGETPFTLAGEGAAETVDVRLPGFATIMVHVTRSDGVTPWAGALVLSSDTFRSFFQSRGMTDANGNLTLQRSNADATPEQFAEGDVTIRVYDANTGVALLEATATVRFADVNGNVDVSIGGTIIGGNVTGHVYAVDGTTPIPDAYVQLLNGVDLQPMQEVNVGADGAFSFLDVVPGQLGFVVRAHSPTESAAIDRAGTFTTAGETLQIDLVVPVTSAIISGHLFAGDGQTPVRTSYVILIDSQGNELEYANPDATGGYSFGLRYFDAPGFSLRATEYTSGTTATVSGTIPAVNAQVTVDITVPVSIVYGRVRFADGTGVRRASMFVLDSTGVTRDLESNDDGSYAIVNLAPGQIVVTAQDDNSGLNATATGTLVSVAAGLALDVQLPPSGTVTGIVTDAGGLPVSGASIALVSANLQFERYTDTDSDGRFTFTRVPAGSVYVQAFFYDGTDYRYVARAGEVIGNDTLTLALAWNGGGTVTGIATAADGGPAGGVLVALRGFSGMGPNGMYSGYTFDGSYTFTGVPAGRVQLVVYAWEGGTLAGPIGVADGEVTAGGTLTLNVALGNGVDSHAIFDGDDGFRYDVAPNGTLEAGGTVDGSLRNAYSGADRLQINGLDFPTVDAARPAGSGRELMYGPVPMPDVLATREVYVPQSGGFARYLETLTNPTAVPQTITVGVTGYTGSGDPRILVAPSTTGNTFTVTDFPNCDCSTSTLGRVFQGSGAPALSVSTTTMVDSHFAFTYQLTLAPGAAVTIMHFEVQRDTNDAAGAEAQAVALVNLTDPHALDGMSEAERAQVVNFVIPR